MFSSYVQQTNAPGLRRIVMLPDDQMAANGVLDSELTVLELIFPTTRGSLSVADGGNGPFGRVFNSQVSVTLPRVLTEVQDFLTAHQERRYILYVEDANARVHRIGGSGDGAEVNISYAIDPSLNATTVTLSHSGPVGLPYGAGGLVGIHTGAGVLDGYSIEYILASSRTTVVEQLQMINVANTWQAQNLPIIADEGYDVVHSLNSIKVVAMFFDTDGTERKDISYEVIDADTVRVYLPIPDGGGSSTFTGDVFLIKRD